MNCAYRLIWNECLNAWSVVPEIATARGKGGAGKRSAAVLLLTLAFGSHVALAADLAATALPGGAQVTAGQATVSTSGASMAINQSSQRAIINWQNFDIGSQAQVNFQQPNASAVALNRVSGPTASRIEGQLNANGQVFLVNPNGVLFGAGARVNVGALAVSTLNIRDEDFLGGNYFFTGTGGSIANQGQISAAPGGYLAFISPTITNSGTLSAPQGTVAMGAGERVRLNFAGDRLVGLDVSADTIDTLITNSQAIRAEGGAILLTAAGAEAVTRSAINNTGVLEAGSLTRDGGRIVLSAGGDINLGAGSTVAVDGKKGGEITAQAQSGTLLADGQLTARGAGGTGGTVNLLGRQVGLVNAALVDASGAMGGGTVLVGGDYQGKNSDVQNAQRTFVDSSVIIKADAAESGNGGRVVVWADEITRYYGSISAKGGSQGGDGGFVEVSGKRNLGFNGLVDTTAANGAFGTLLLDPTDITVVAGATPSPPAAADGLWSFSEDPGSQTIGAGAIASLLNTNNLTLQATNNIVVSSAIAYSGAPNRTLTLQANNNITVSQGISSTGGRLGMVLTADADSMGGGSLAVNAALSSRGGDISLSGVSVSSTAAITTTGATNNNGGNLVVNGTSIAGNINLAGAVVTTGGTASAGSGRNAGDVTIYGAGVVTTGAITANGNNGNGANQAGGNGGTVAITSNGILLTGNLTASGGNGGQVAGSVAAGGNAGCIAVTNNSTTSGTLTTGTLTARAGVARGAIISGAAGSVNVTNNAATLLQTGAINTSGQAGGAGGDVALTSAGGVTTSTIATGGGTLNATTAAAGRNAGNVTIKGVNRSIAGAITTSGGAAIVAGNAGGAGGNVLVTGTDGTIATAGTLSTTGITAANGGALGTVASGTAGSIALEATQITATGALTTTGGANGAGGAITATTSTGSLTVNGAITATGGAANAGSVGRNAGNVTINGAGAVTTGAITANGTNGNGAGQAGGNGGAIAVTSNGTLLTGNLAASGGNGVATAAGGNAGSIAVTNNSTTSGTLTTGTLTARAGAAAGAIISGAAGSVNITNKAATLLRTGAINTSGQAGGAGGDVTLTSAGDVSVTSTIANGGGALNTGTTAAGRNAGNLTISGVNRSVTGAITASGGAGLGTNQAGGKAGTVSLTGSGTLNTAAITASTGAATGTGASGSVGGITLNGTTVTAGALTTTGGINGNGGTISATSTTGNLSVGAIAASGGTANAGNAGRNAGAVTLGSAGNITATTITAVGTAGNGTGQAGGGGNAIALTAAGSITTTTLNSSGGNSSAGGNANGGNAGSITLDGGGATPLINLGGNITATGGNRIGTGVAGAGGTITVADTLNIGTANRTISSRGGSTGLGAGGTINLGGPIYDSGARTLTVTGGSGTVSIAGGAANATLANNLDTLVVTASDGAGKIRVGSVNTVAAQSYDAGSGGIELNGNVATLGSAGADTVTFSDPVTLTGNSSITTAGGSGDNIAISQTVNGAFGLTLNAGAVGNVSTSAVIGGGTPLTAFSATGAAVTFGQSVTAGSIFARSTTGNMTLNASAVLTGTGVGNAIELVAGGAASRFINNAGAGALNASNTAGRFLVWSQNPANDTRGGLVYAFKQYNATYGVTPVADTSANNDGFLYVLAPTITPGLTGSVAKVYDGTTTAVLATGNFTATGAVDGDTVTLSGTGTYANRNVGTAKTVTATGITASASNGAATVYGYQVNPASASANIGTITQAALTLNAVTDSKVYDGTTTSTGSVAASNLQTGDTYTASQSFDSRNAGARTLAVNGGYVINDGNGGNNYTVNTATAAGSITAAPLTVTAQPDSRVYDGTTGSAVAPVVTGITYDAVGTAATQSYDNRNVGTGKTLTAGGLVMNDGNGGANYAVSYIANNTGVISPAALVLNASSATKVYDGTTASSGVVGVVGLQSGDTLSGLTQRFASKNVLGANGSTLRVDAGYVVSDGNGGANYAVTTSTALGSITPAGLSLHAVSDSKVYDGTTSSGGVVSTVGLVGGDTLSGLTQRFASKNVLGTNGSTLAVNAGYVVSDGNGGANYTVTTSTAPGTITPASMVIAADDKSRPFGAPNPPFTASYAGFVAGETAAVLDGTLSFLTAATTSSAPGGYSITPFGQTSGNYAIAYVDGTLMVVGAPVRPGAGGETAAYQQAIGAQYTSRRMPDDVLSRIRYVFADDKCKDASGTTDVPCAGGSVVRMVNGGILLPRQ